MKTIAQQIKWDFKTNGNLAIQDKNNKLIYWEGSNRVWEKSEYDSQGRLIYRENSFGRIIDKRPKSCENKEIVIDGVKFKLVKV